MKKDSRRATRRTARPATCSILYGAADIPETESFGLTELPIVGLRGDAVGVSVDPDPPSVTIGRFASSAAHVMGTSAGFE